MRLFGGALLVDLDKFSLQDASELRQVPDNQEVFVGRDSDMSIVIELLEYDSSMTVESHFSELANDNQADESVILEREGTAVLHGVQTVSKFNKAQKDKVHIYLGLLRLEEYKTDILMSINCPTITFEEFKKIFISLTVKDPSIFSSY
jgi:hypothetical protein